MQRRVEEIEKVLLKAPKAKYPELESEYFKLYHKLYYQKYYFMFGENSGCSCHMCRPDPNDRDTKRNRIERVLDKEMKEEIRL